MTLSGPEKLVQKINKLGENPHLSAFNRPSSVCGWQVMAKNDN